MWRGVSLSKAKESVESGSGVKPISVRPGVKVIQSSGGAMLSRRRWSWRGGVEVGGVERVGEEGVLDVGGDELLVLLLVLEAEGDAAGGFGVDGDRLLEQAGDGGVDVGAVGEDVGRAAGGRSWRGAFFSGMSPREL